MRRNNFFISTLSMGLLYLSLYMGVIVVNLRGTLRAGAVDYGVTAHYAVILFCGLALYLFVRKGMRSLRFLFIFLLLVALFNFMMPFLPEALLARFFSGKLPVVALSMALFTPIALYLFARSIPVGKEAFCFALLIAGSELLWALFFPLLGIISAAAEQYAVYLFSLCCWMIGGAGLCLAWLLGNSEKEAKDEYDYNQFYEYKKWHLLAVAFMAGVVMWVMMGFQMDVFIPKMALQSAILGMPHFIFLFSAPFIGWFIDLHPIKVVKVLIPVLLCIFILSLAHNAEYVGIMPLYYLLNILQIIVVVSIYATTAKLLRMHSSLPVFIALAHSLLVFQYVGLLLRRPAVARPFGLPIVSLLLVLCMLGCLWYFYKLVLARRRHGFTSYAAVNKEMEDSKKLSAFATAHMLTARERDVLFCLLQGLDRDDIMQKLGIAERTLRHHTANLLKKANVPNERSVLDYYNSWKEK